MQRTDVRIDLYSDEEGLYDVVVSFDDPGTPRIIVDPRNVSHHIDSDEAIANPPTASGEALGIQP